MSRTKQKRQPKQDRANSICPQIVKISKRMSGTLRLTPVDPCKCDCITDTTRQKIYQANYDAVLNMLPAVPCDETDVEPLLQFGAELRLQGLLQLREDRCVTQDRPILLGRQQGTFQIHRFRPNEDVITGSYCGTVGFLPTTLGPDRCCAPGRGLGSLCGKGVNKLAGWSLSAIYHCDLANLNEGVFCRNAALEVEMNLEGVLVGPCVTLKHEEAPQARTKRKVAK